MTFLEKLNRFPPFVCRLVATKKNGWLPLSTTEIAQRAVIIGRSRVAEISKLEKWDDLRASEILAFSKACGVDLTRIPDEIDKLKKLKLVHMQRAHPRQRKLFFRLLSGMTSGASSPLPSHSGE